MSNLVHDYTSLRWLSEAPEYDNKTYTALMPLEHVEGDVTRRVMTKSLSDGILTEEELIKEDMSLKPSKHTSDEEVDNTYINTTL